MTALSLVTLTAQSPAVATADASVTLGTPTCTGSFSQCSAESVTANFLAPGQFIGLSVPATITIFDEGLSGAKNGGAQFNPGFCLSVFCQQPIPEGFEWAYANVWVGEQPRDSRTLPPNLDVVYDNNNYFFSTKQDASPDFFSTTITLEGSAFCPPESLAPGCILGTSTVRVGVFADTFSQSGVAPIPEPQTYAMLLTGLALLGFVMKRRSAFSVPARSGQG